MGREGKAGERNEDDLIYGGANQLSESQLDTADYLLGGRELGLESREELARRLEGEPLHTVNDAESADTEEAPAEPTRAEKNAKMMSLLLSQKISATLDGNTAEANRLEGMIQVLKARMEQ